MKKRNIFFIVGIALAVFAGIIALVVFNTNKSAQGEENGKLYYIAGKYKIIADGTGETKGLHDGNLSTWWCSNEYNWPAVLTVAIPPRGILIDQIIVRFLQEDEFPNRTMDVNIEFGFIDQENQYINMSDFKMLGQHLSYTFPNEVKVNKIKVTLSNPKENGNVGSFWPALQEIELYSTDTSPI